jgi:hypothetical protein
MTSGRIEYALAVLSTLCVLAIFFFPAMQGPYSVVHGPVTALLAARTAAGLRARITRSALSIVRNYRSRTQSACRQFHWRAVAFPEFSASCLPIEGSAVLRC